MSFFRNMSRLRENQVESRIADRYAPKDFDRVQTLVPSFDALAEPEPNASVHLTGTRDGGRYTFGAGDDRIEARSGDDVISTGDGNDFIVGGAGSDRQTGGAGADVFLHNVSTFRSSTDTILDFELSTYSPEKREGDLLVLNNDSGLVRDWRRLLEDDVTQQKLDDAGFDVDALGEAVLGWGTLRLDTAEQFAFLAYVLENDLKFPWFSPRIDKSTGVSLVDDGRSTAFDLGKQTIVLKNHAGSSSNTGASAYDLQSAGQFCIGFLLL